MAVEERVERDATGRVLALSGRTWADAFVAELGSLSSAVPVRSPAFLDTRRNIYTCPPPSVDPQHLLLLLHRCCLHMPDVFVKSFSHLKDRPHADKALPLLQRIASLVKPIMRKHSWVLPVLSEFFPADDNLLGE